tara:strand:- start:87 stop:425 length:339 start_codon:yes stop_codon:yes gene_type:complete
MTANKEAGKDIRTLYYKACHLLDCSLIRGKMSFSNELQAFFDVVSINTGKRPLRVSPHFLLCITRLSGNSGRHLPVTRGTVYPCGHYCHLLLNYYIIHYYMRENDSTEPGKS